VPSSAHLKRSASFAAAGSWGLAELGNKLKLSQPELAVV